MGLIHLVYVSSATQEFSEPELVALLQRTRTRNAAAGVTGLLLYRGGNFMQVLEGEEETVKRLHERIAADPRHRGLITLVKAPIAERTFTEWAMSFRNLDSKEVQSTPGYSQFLNDDWMALPMQKNPDRALKLLQTFRGGMK